MDAHAYAMPIAPGTMLAGRYQVERVLGKGAMGVVVAARHIELGELFAIKLLLPQTAAQPQAVDRFLREARAAARLKSEHVVKVTDVGRLENGSPYMVMEHLTGTDLQQLVRTGGPLPVEEAVTYVLQACDAIAEAHALGIVHRDLKPSNLFLIRRRNGTGCVKVLDFGISKQIVQEAVDLTKTGDVFGTPLYMAPEQMARTKNADARADIWSMGIVLYELVTGTTPFHASTLTEVVARVLQEDAPPPSSVRREIPPAIDAVVARCLQKRPDLRFQSVEDLAAALRAATVCTDPTAPRASSSPALQTAPPASLARAPVAPTLMLPEQEPRAQLPAPVNAPPGLPASTVSSWGSTGRMRATGSSGMVAALAAGGAVAALLAGGGVWFALRSPSEVGSNEEVVPSASAKAARQTEPAASADPPMPPSSAAAELPVLATTGTSNAAPATASASSTVATGTVISTSAPSTRATLPRASSSASPPQLPPKKKKETFR